MSSVCLYFAFHFSPHTLCHPQASTCAAHTLLYMCVYVCDYSLQVTQQQEIGQLSHPSQNAGQIGLSTSLNLLIIPKTCVMLLSAALLWNQQQIVHLQPGVR